jgi:hypothetical protein
MEINWVMLASVNAAWILVVLIAAIAVRRNGMNRDWKDQFAQFADAVRGVEMTNSAYFRSLEQMLKNLEFVRGCTEQAERRLSDIVSRSGSERDGRYQTAALLLSAGEKPAKIAAMLNLPLSQVKRARESQKTPAKGRKPLVQRVVAEEATTPRKERMSLWSARVKKLFPQPVVSENGGDGHEEGGSGGFNGTAGS